MTEIAGDDISASFRRTLDLDGQWEFLTDPNNTGRTDRWYDPDMRWPDRTRKIFLPRAWEEDEISRDYTGTAWYRRTFIGDELEVDTHGRETVVRFNAVDYETSVWINGEHVGDNRGGYLPFELDVTDELVNGENSIVVAVTDPEDLSEIPHGKQGDPWYTRVSGIWQSVHLESRPRTHVSAARVTPDLDADIAIIDLEVEIAPTDVSSLCAIVRAHRDGELVAMTTVSSMDNLTAVLEFDDPDYWTLAEPALYDLEVILESDGRVIDLYEDYFGLRSFEVADGEFLLNGEPITIRGVLEQGYYPETLYRPSDEDTYATEIETASDLGFNLIRKHIKPAHPNFLNYADQNGMLVWQEPANPTRYTERSRAEVQMQLEGLLERDYNRPSVVMWSLYNEEWGIGHHGTEETLWTDTEKQQFLADCYRDIRELDPTRIVCDNSGWAHVATDVNDFHRYFASPDRADEWVADLDHICSYAGDNYATTEFDDTNAPIVISELGTWGLSDINTLRDRYGGDPYWFNHDFIMDQLKSPAGIDDRFEQTNLSDVFEDYTDLATEWQEREFVSIKHLIEEMRTRDEIAGYVLTELSDIEWEFNGLLDYHREPKSFISRFGRINDAITIIATPDAHVVWVGDNLDVEFAIINDTNEPLSGSFQWSLSPSLSPPSHPESETESAIQPTIETKSGSITVPPHSVHRFEVRVPCDLDDEPAEITNGHLSATFELENRTVLTEEPITIIDPDRHIELSPTVYAEGVFASRLAEGGLTVTHTLSDMVDVAFTTEITGRVDEFASSGGAVVHIPDTDGDMTAGGPFTYRSVPRTESWNAVTALFYQDSPLLDDLCPHCRLGWEFDGLYPYSVATDLDPSVDRVHVGYVEGWIANWGSPFVVRGYGQGSMTALTFDIYSEYGRHPVATVLCERLLTWLGN